MRSKFDVERLGISDSVLWLLLALAGIAFYTSLVPLEPNDFWWHLKVGEIISTQGNIPTTNLFAWTLPAGQLYVYGEWLAGWLLYQLYRLGGCRCCCSFAP